MELIESDIANMNINSKSGIFESSSKTQSEIQSCKLDESESRPNVTLKKMGQELNEAETKCFTLKSELNYVMGVCQKVKTEMKDTLRLSSKSSQLSPRRIVDNDDASEEFESLKQQKQNGLLNVTIMPKTQLDKKFPTVMTMTPVQSEILKASGEYENPLFFSEYMRGHLQSMLNVENSIEELTSKADEENYFCIIPPNSVKKDIRDTKLNLNVTNNAKIRRAEKSKRASRMERSESNSIYNKAGHTLPKMRKRKGRLHSSVSKSTIATKDTNFGRKEAKKRKHRAHGVIHQLSNPPKNLKKSNDVVEIFHNTTVKSSNSGISNSKHSKFDKQTKCIKRHPTETANQKIQEISYSEHVNHIYQFDNKENEQHQSPQSLNYQCDSRMIHERVQEHDISEKHSKDFYPSAQYNKTHQCEHNAFNKCNDPMFIPSYEMPTLASRLKRSNRSYFNRFNFRNIPFVVGTSVTPSHNLGLNIQQVLSVMKTRQPIANDITPLLIRKVSRGMKPMSILLEQMNDYSQKSALNINSHLSGIFNNTDSSNIKRNKKLSAFNLQHVENITSNVGSAKMISEKDNNIAKQFNKEKIDFNDHKIKLQSPVVNKSMPMNVRNQQRVAKISSNKEINIGDYKTRAITGAHNSKEIRDILINLHDQFEEMNTKYEKLQSEVGKSSDKSLVKELSAMEKELNIKEEEINAVIGLYKEVKTLKHQMKMLHEKNSLVCITTESIEGSHKNSFPMSILPGKSHSMNPTQIFGQRKLNATREPPTSMQLAVLLRQIQTFYKQMQLVS